MGILNLAFRMLPQRRVLAFVTSILLVSAVVAHEFWLQPDSYRPAVGQATPIRLLVGDGFPGERRVRDPKKLERLDLIGPAKDDKSRAITGKDGEDPVGSITPEKAGVHAIVYRGKEALITLEAEKFEAYLKEEGLDDIIQRRKDLNESAKEGREAYSRCAKALLCAGSDTAGAWNTNAGLTLEIVPATNPYAAHAGDTLTFTLFEEGKPVKDAMLAALTFAEGKTERLTARTGSDGKASFILNRPGLWLVNAVRMDRAKNRTDVDWVSVWSSLTFDLAAAPEPKAPAHP